MSSEQPETSKALCGDSSYRRSRACVAVFLCTFVSLSAGCSKPTADQVNQDHGGHIIDLAGHEQMKLEFAIDEQLNQLIVYVLETEGLEPLPVTCKQLEIAFLIDGEDVPVVLDAQPQPDDPEGKASQFATSFQDLPELLYGATNFTAEFTFELEGETVSGTLHHHDDHTHHHD